MKSLFYLLFLTLLFLGLCACNVPYQNTAAPTEDYGVQYTQAAQTVAAQLTQQAAPVAPGSVEVTEAALTQTPLPVEPTATPLPTQTPTPESTPTLTTTPCIDKLEFVADVTIPDNSVLTPGESFVKIWQLRNVGTCTWTDEYELVFVEGEIMGGPGVQALDKEVKPGETIDVSVNLKAPGTTGTYRGDWMLRNARDINFGGGDKADKTFWVLIKVEEGQGDLNLGAPDWTDKFDSSGNWYLLDTEDTRFEIKDGHMVMISLNAGGGEEWGLSNRPAMTDYYLEATFQTGDSCSGLDRYGVLVRAPDPNRGYVYGFSCDGRYRIYKWDGENYAPIQEWKSSPHIKAGTNQTNRLGIWLQGNTIRLYANGKLLAEFTDSTFDEGRFGLFIGSTNTDDFIVYVEEVSYWILGD